MLKRLSFGHEIVVLCPGLFIAKKRVNPLADVAHIWLIEYGLAQFASFLEDRSLFNRSLHVSFRHQYGMEQLRRQGQRHWEIGMNYRVVGRGQSSFFCPENSLEKKMQD